MTTIPHRCFRLPYLAARRRHDFTTFRCSACNSASTTYYDGAIEMTYFGHYAPRYLAGAQASRCHYVIAGSKSIEYADASANAVYRSDMAYSTQAKDAQYHTDVRQVAQKLITRHLYHIAHWPLQARYLAQPPAIRFQAAAAILLTISESRNAAARRRA